MKPMKPITKKKLAFMIMVMILAVFIFSIVAEATIKDTARNAWGKTKGGISKAWNKIKVFAVSGKFWINFALVFATLFILFNVFIREKMGSDNATKIMLFIIIGIIALIIATKIVDAQGNPTYLWTQEKFRAGTQFLIGPTGTNSLPSCPEPTWYGSLWNGMKSSVGAGGEPPCCGTGSYIKTYKGKSQCKQAILRVNDSGAGLPAFLIASIILFILFNKLISGMDKKYNIGLAVLLGAMLANERITKNQILVIAGWVAFIWFAKIMLAKMGKKDDKENFGGKVIAIALPYATVNLALGILGTSLFGTSIDSAQVGLGMVVLDFIVGALAGGVYATMTGDIMSKRFEEMDKKKQEIISKHMKNGDYAKAMAAAAPFPVGWLYRRIADDPTLSEVEKSEKESEKNLSRLDDSYQKEKKYQERIEKELSKPEPNMDKLNQYQALLYGVRTAIRDEKKTNIDRLKKASEKKEEEEKVSRDDKDEKTSSSSETSKIPKKVPTPKDSSAVCVITSPKADAENVPFTTDPKEITKHTIEVKVKTKDAPIGAKLVLLLHAGNKQYQKVVEGEDPENPERSFKFELEGAEIKEHIQLIAILTDASGKRLAQHVTAFRLKQPK